MGQYWKAVNLDKKEYIEPHKLGTGLKLWEQLVNTPGTPAAMIILCAAQRGKRGGGDLSMPESGDYGEVARRTIGRWAGDKVALVGDYTEDDDLPPWFEASKIYELCHDAKDVPNLDPASLFTDVSQDVAAVIEHECGGKFKGNGWRRWETNDPEISLTMSLPDAATLLAALEDGDHPDPKGDHNCPACWTARQLRNLLRERKHPGIDLTP